MINLKSPFIPDVSYWEDDLHVDLMTPKPDHVIIRASWGSMNGSRGEDALAVEFENQCRKAGINFSLYHYLTPNHIAEQADLFLAMWHKAGTVTPPIVDVEVILPDSIGRAVWREQVKTFLDRVAVYAQKTPIIYTNQYYWQELSDANGNPPPWTDDYPLWLAWYPDHPDNFNAPPANIIPRGWNRWALWQYSEKGRANGQPANDLNIAADWFMPQLTENPIPPPTGELMTTGKVNITAGVAIRPTPSTDGNKLGEFAYNTIVTINSSTIGKDGKLWYNVTGKATNGQTMTGWCFGQYITPDPITPPPPPPPPPVTTNPAYLTAHYADGTVKKYVPE